MKRAHPWLWLAALAGLGVLPLVVWIYRQPGLHLPPTGDETGMGYVTAFTAYYAVYALCALPLYFLAPPAGRPALMAALSVGFLCSGLSPGLALAGAINVIGVYAILRLPRGRVAAFVAWSAAFYAIMPPHLMSLTVGDRFVTRGIDAASVAFFALFYKMFKRTVFVVYERAVGRVRDVALLELFNYTLGLPFLAINSATPSFAHFRESRAEDPGPIVARGARTSLECLLCLFAWMALVDPHRSLLRAFAHGDRAFTVIVGLSAIWFLRYFLRRMASEQLSVGTCRLFGHDVRDDFTLRVLLSANVLEYWRQWNMLWREFLVTAIYYPLMLRMARRARATSPWMYAAAGFVTLMGAAVFDILPRGFFFVLDWSPAMTDNVVTMLLYRFAWGVLVGANLYLQARLGGRLRALGRWTWPLRVILTLTLICLLHLLAMPTRSLDAKLSTVIDVLGL